MSTPSYRVSLSFEPERKLYVARAPELPHCTGEGPTRGQAIAHLEEEIDAQVQNMRAQGTNPPSAVDEEQVTGEITAKVSQTLHRQLLFQARAEGVELDHLVGEVLAAALERRLAARSGRTREASRPAAEVNENIGNGPAPGNVDRTGQNRGRGYNPRYQNSAHLLDDRANFIEYVRGLEHSGGVPPNARGPGGSGGPSGPGGSNGNGARRRRRGGPVPGGSNGGAGRP